jgi:hypothetical protein
MNLPCPQCGSHRTLNGLRKKKREVEERIESRKRYPVPATPAHSHAVSGHTHALASPPFNQHAHISAGPITINDTSNGIVTAGTSIVMDDSLVIGRDLIRVEGSNETIIINGATLDTCADCGTLYASNAKDLADELQTEIYDMDPLGAMAEIYDEDDSLDG